MAWEHYFLVTEYIDGSSLLDEIIQRYPLVHPDPTDAELADYMAWAIEIFAHLEHALADIHARGVRVGDIHPNNIIVRPNSEVAIIDFECASRQSCASLLTFGAPGLSPQQVCRPRKLIVTRLIVYA